MSRFVGAVRAFFARPAVQSVVRHAVTAAIAAAIPVFLAGGVPALVGAVGAAAILRAVWVAVRPDVVQEFPDLEGV